MEKDAWINVIIGLADKVGGQTEAVNGLRTSFDTKMSRVHERIDDTNKRVDVLVKVVDDFDVRLRTQEEIEKNRDVIKEQKKRFWQKLDKKTKDAIVIVPAIIAIVTSAISLFYNH